jgi:hypothetical protein
MLGGTGSRREFSRCASRESDQGFSIVQMLAGLARKLENREECREGTHKPVI